MSTVTALKKSLADIMPGTFGKQTAASRYWPMRRSQFRAGAYDIFIFGV
jgi:hypothetical protein